MTLLITGLALFFAVHLAAAGPARGALTQSLGEAGRKVLVTIGSAIGLGLIIWGKGQAAFVPAFEPPFWGRAAAVHAMPIALIILAWAYVPGRMRRILRHPMLLAVLIWAGLHLLANGDWASVWLFGLFAVYVPVSIAFAERRGYQPAAPGRWAWDGAGVIIGVVASFLLMRFHGVLFGPALML